MQLALLKLAPLLPGVEIAVDLVRSIARERSGKYRLVCSKVDSSEWNTLSRAGGCQETP